MKVAESDGLFIVSTNLDKHDSRTRKSIRSHVMRGKNTRQSRYMRLQLRQRQRTEQAQTDSSEQSQSEHEETFSPDAVMVRKEPWVLSSPRAIASELSLFAYEDEMQPYMLNLIKRGMLFQWLHTLPCHHRPRAAFLTRWSMGSLSSIYHRQTRHLQPGKCTCGRSHK